MAGRLLSKSVISVFLISLMILCFSIQVHALTDVSLALSSGYRADSLDWNIAGNFAGTNPDILSELRWTDLQIFQVGAAIEIARPLRDRIDIVLLGETAYGWILAGDNQDSDYAADGRTLEWSRSNNDAGDGHVLDLSGGVGIRFSLHNDQWMLTPQVGYAYYEQDLVIQNGFQTLSVDMTPTFPLPPPVGPIAGLNSSYYAWWFGPWLGLQAGYQQNKRVLWDTALRWYKVEYRAEADWNLRSDLQHPVSFEHVADGDGISFKVGFEYLFDHKWQAGFTFDYRDFKAEDGIDVVYLDSGVIGGTRFNEVNWQSWSLALSLQYNF